MWSTARRNSARPLAANARNVNRRTGGSRHSEARGKAHVEQQLVEWTRQRAQSGMAAAPATIPAPSRSNPPRRPSAVIDGVVIDFAIIETGTAPGRKPRASRQYPSPQMALPRRSPAQFKLRQFALPQFDWSQIKRLRRSFPAFSMPLARLPQVSWPQLARPRNFWPRPMYRWMAAGFALGVAFWHFVGFWDFIGRTVLPENRLPVHSTSNFSQPAKVASGKAPALERIKVSHQPSPAHEAPFNPGRHRAAAGGSEGAVLPASAGTGTIAAKQPAKSRTMRAKERTHPDKPQWPATVMQTSGNW